MNTPSFLQGPNGERSSMRLVFWFYALLVGVVWAFCSFKGASLAPIPREVVDLVGYLTGGKVLQSALAESGLAGAVSAVIQKKEEPR